MALMGHAASSSTQGRLLCLLLLAFLGLSAVEVARGAANDKWGPACKTFPLADPPVGGFKKWSDPRTWQLPKNGIPGVGALAGVDVEIPCNVSVQLDVPEIRVALLDIKGHLKVVDNSTTLLPGPTIDVYADYIAVQGQLTIGAATKAFKGKITFTLTNTSAPRTFVVSRPPLSNNTFPASALDLGQKVFAVIGGIVRLYGLDTKAPSWVKLKATVLKGDTVMTVTPSVTGYWPVGARIALTSTDYDRTQAEEVTITNVTANGTTSSLVSFSPRLNFSHWGAKVAGYPGKYVDESGEVALLTRSIVIKGTIGPDPLIGGHFMVFHTNNPLGQIIQGVEFVSMGQQGSLGRYPLHFHLCEDAFPSQVVKNSIHDSLQRCIVIHGTHRVNVVENVAFRTKGHCIMTEDGVETQNNFTRNLAFWQDAVAKERLIPTVKGVGAVESDDSPSSFWIANPNNNYVGNVAGGAADSGYWFQLSGSVLGPSAGYPNVSTYSPFVQKLGLFTDNVAHSSTGAGMRFYPFGYVPATGTNWDALPVGVTFKNLRIFKNAYDGLNLHNVKHITIDGGLFADNGIGVDVDDIENVTITNTVVIGESANWGNPTGCEMYPYYADCWPTDSCTMPPPKNSTNIRSTGRTYKFRPSIGILFNGQFLWNGGTPPTPNRLITAFFSGFKPSCNKTMAAFGIKSRFKAAIWPAATSIQGLKVAADGSLPVWVAPPVMPNNTYSDEWWDAGQVATWYAVRDRDGSITGSGGGYIISNNSAIAANLKSAPTPACKPSTLVQGGLICPKACYRSVNVFWYKAPQLNLSTWAVTFTRLSDGAQVNVSSSKTSWNDLIYTSVNLLAGQTYRVYLPNGAPQELRMQYADSPRFPGDERYCEEGLTLQIPPPPGQGWSHPLLKGCGSPTRYFLPNVTTMSWVCDGSTTLLQVSMDPTIIGDAQLAIKQNATVPFCPGTPCLKAASPPPARSPPPFSPPPLSPPPADPHVLQVSWQISPSPTSVSLTVRAGLDTVKFIWTDKSPHSVTGADKASLALFGGAKGTGSQMIVAPFSITFSFPNPGTYRAICGVHGLRMSAVITVI